MIPLACRQLNFDERIGFITKHDDFVPSSRRAVSLQVAPFSKIAKAEEPSSLSRSNGKRVSLSDSSYTQIEILIRKISLA